jgi:subtilase family serine protease
MSASLLSRSAAALLLAAIITPAQTWVSAGTRGVGNLLANATPLGAADPSMTLHIAVALQLNNKSALLQYVSAINDPASPLYESSLSVDQFISSYAPTAAQVPTSPMHKYLPRSPALSWRCWD